MADDLCALLNKGKLAGQGKVTHHYTDNGG